MTAARVEELRLHKDAIVSLLKKEISDVPSIPVGPRPESIPLAHAQQRLWFLHQLGLVGAAYNLPMALCFEGSLDIAALECSLTEIVRRHESLRTRVESRDGEAVQIVDAPRPCVPAQIDLSDLESEARRCELARLIQNEGEQLFDLSTGPLIRASVVTLSPVLHVLLLTVHHIVSDSWSQGILVRELAALYRAFSLGEPSPLADLPLQYADYALWQREWLQGDVLQQQLDYWQRRLIGAPPTLELPTDRPRPAVASFKGGAVSFELSPQLSRSLQELAQRERATPYMVLLAAFFVLLSRWSGQKDLLIGSPLAGRRHRQLEPLIGFFVNTLIMRGELSASPTFTDFLAQVKETTLGAYAHQDVPFEQLVDELQPVRDLSRQPVFQVSFSLQNVPAAAVEGQGPRFRGMDREHVTAKFDLTLFMTETPTGLHGMFEYASDLFDRQTIERLSGRFALLLQGIVEDPRRRCIEVPLVSEPESPLSPE